jgi:hypothetical protein
MILYKNPFLAKNFKKKIGSVATIVKNCRFLLIGPIVFCSKHVNISRCEVDAVQFTTGVVFLNMPFAELQMLALNTGAFWQDLDTGLRGTCWACSSAFGLFKD